MRHPSARVFERHPVVYLLALWFGVGRFPWGPGTAATVAAAPLCFGLSLLGYGWVLLGALVLTLVGVRVSAIVARLTRDNDPKYVVIDEVAGIFLTYAFAPQDWKGLVVSVVLFRLFDITKPWPCRVIERKLPPGPGIMLDDTCAALMAGGVLLVARVLGLFRYL